MFITILCMMMILPLGYANQYATPGYAFCSDSKSYIQRCTNDFQNLKNFSYSVFFNDLFLGHGWMMLQYSHEDTNFAVYYLYPKDINIVSYHERVVTFSDTAEVLTNHRTWYHLAGTVREDGLTIVYINGEIVFNSFVQYDNPIFPPGGCFKVAAEFPIVFENKFYGILDEVMLWDRILSQEEVQKIYQNNVDSDVLEGLWLHWGFDTYNNATVFDESGNGRDGFISPSFKNEMLCPSTSPWGFKNIKVLHTIPLNYSQIEWLPGSYLLSLPDHGMLLDMNRNKIVDISNPINDAYIYYYNLIEFSNDTFEALIEGNNVTFIVKRNNPPFSNNTIFDIDDEDKLQIFLGINMNAAFVIYNDFIAVDYDGDNVTIEVLGISHPDNFYYQDQKLKIGDTVKYRLNITIFVLKNSTNMTINYRLHDHLEYSKQNYTVTIVSHPLPAAPLTPNTFFRGSEDVNVSISITFPGEDLSQLITHVTKLPSHGKLFHYDPETNETGDEVNFTTGVTRSQGSIVQWASRVVNFSSWWETSLDNWNPNQILNEPDAYPYYGDSFLSWCGGKNNRDEYIIVEFDTEVYPISVLIYENYYPGCTDRIDVYNKENDEWVTVWKEDPFSLHKNTTVYQTLHERTLCPVSFPTNRMNISTRACGVGSFVEFDAIQLTGSLVPETDLIVKGLIYIPDPNYNGIDNFQINTNTCKRFIVVRDYHINYQNIAINLTSINDPPVVNDISISLDTVGSRILLFLGFNSDDSAYWYYRIATAPQYGTLYRNNTPIGSYPATFNIYTNISFSVDSCFNSAFNITITAIDDGGLKSDFDVIVTPHCLDKTIKITSGTGIFGVVIVSVAIVALIVTLMLLIVNRDKSIITRSSPLFLYMILFGCILSVITITFNIDYPNTVKCNIQLWTLSIGYIIAYGSLLAKNVRMYYLFRIDITTKIFKITDTQVVSAVGILLIPQIILLILWTTLAPLQSTFNGQYFVCRPDGPKKPTSDILLALTLVYCYILLVVGCIVSFQSKIIPKRFNEFRPIAYSTYNLFVVGTIALALVLFLEDNIYVTFVAETISIFLCCMFTIGFLFWTKFYSIFTGRDSEIANSDKTRNTSKTTKTSKSSSVVEKGQSDH